MMLDIKTGAGLPAIYKLFRGGCQPTFAPQHSTKPSCLVRLYILSSLIVAFSFQAFVLNSLFITGVTHSLVLSNCPPRPGQAVECSFVLFSPQETFYAAVFLYIYRTPDSVPFDGIVPIFALVRKVCRSGNWTVDRHCPQFLFLVSKLLLSTSLSYVVHVQCSYGSIFQCRKKNR